MPHYYGIQYANHRKKLYLEPYSDITILMSIEKDDIRFRFINEVLSALHLESKSFFYDVAQKRPYEVLIYNWINKLYKKGKSREEAIEQIHRARRLFILRTYNAPKP